MDDKLTKTLLSPDFPSWRHKLWKEISAQAIGEGWVPEHEIGDDGLIDPECDRWGCLWARLVRF
jgi:hypothetical protein